jgi:hypothetical protein
LTQTNNIFFADYNDKASLENWQHLITRYPDAQRIPAGLSKEATCESITTNASHFWLIDGHCRLLDSFNLTFNSTLDEAYVWKNTDNHHDTLSLLYIPVNSKLNNKVNYLNQVTVQCSTIVYDIIYINYDESLGDVKQVTARLNECDLWAEAAMLSDTHMFWLIDPNVPVVQSFDLNMNIPVWDTCYINHWPDELLLIPKNYDFTGELHFKYHTGLASFREKQSHVEVVCDTVFLSYNETNAAENLEQVKKIRPKVKHVHGVTGIYAAHRAAATVSDTEWFWVIDGDNHLLESFNFTVPKNIRTEPPGVFVFACRNKATGMVYGNGGIKLVHKSLFTTDIDEYVDLSTSFEHFTYIDVVASETRIDSDAFTAWRAAFRECVKLSSNIIKNSNSDINRIYLNAWLYASNSKYKEYIQLGAVQGIAWAKQNTHQLHLINDFTWLEQYYEENT